MDIPKYDISVVFPCHNEEANIGRGIEEARKVLARLAGDYEIIAVDDGSTDRTAEVIASYAEKDPHVKLVKNPTNLGYGGSIRAGFDASTMDYIFFTDGDLQFDLNEIELLLPHLVRYDMVLGYRKKRVDPFIRTVNAWAWGTLIRLLFGLKVRDIDCAFKIFRREVYQAVDLTSTGAFVSSEFLIKANKRGYTYTEVPVSHLPRIAGEQSGANIKVILRAFKELFKLYRKLKTA